MASWSSGNDQYTAEPRVRKLTNINQCLVLCNAFLGEEKCELKGYQFDVENIKTTFGDLSFNVYTEYNFSSHNVENKFQKWINDNDFSDSECCICFILSHGFENRFLLGCDHSRVDIVKICSMFDKSTALSEVPKLFFIQACRGTHDPITTKFQRAGVHVRESSIFADNFVYYSTTEGSTSFVEGEGSVFIIQLCNTFKANASTRTLCEMVTEVNMQLATRIITPDDVKYTVAQVSEAESTLVSDILFRSNVAVDEHDQGFKSKMHIVEQSNKCFVLFNLACISHHFQCVNFHADTEIIGDKFSKLNFEVIPIINFEGIEIRNQFDQWKQTDFTLQDCFVCFMLSCGGDSSEGGVVFGSDGERCKLDQLIRNISENETLWNKPKLFFLLINKCSRSKFKGESDTSGVLRAGCNIEKSVEADLFVYSCIINTDKDEKATSMFIAKLCKIILCYSNKSYPLGKIVTKVNEILWEDREIAVASNTLTYEVVFKGGPTVFDRRGQEGWDYTAEPRVRKLTNRNHCLVLCNDFLRDKKWELKGYQCDVENIKATFGGLNFYVYTEYNFSCTNVEDKFQKWINDNDFSNSECCICFILSHGFEDRFLLGSDHSRVDIVKIFSMFDTSTALSEVPKLFFIQACRGTRDPVTTNPKRAGANVRESSIFADNFIYYSTTEGSTSFVEGKGSSFILQLCNTFKVNASTHTLCEMVTEVNMQLSTRIISPNDVRYSVAQVSEAASTLVSDILFRSNVAVDERDQVFTSEMRIVEQSNKCFVLINLKCKSHTFQCVNFNANAEIIQDKFSRVNFEVIPKLNLKGNEIRNQFDQWVETDFKIQDCFLCFVLSCGGDSSDGGVVFGSDGEPCEIDELIRNISENKTLWNKPKLFFLLINKCDRRKFKGERETSEARRAGHNFEKKSIEADSFVYSCIINPDKDENATSTFIAKLCNILLCYSNRSYPLGKIVTRVNEILWEDREIAVACNTLTYEVVFKGSMDVVNRPEIFKKLGKGGWDYVIHLIREDDLDTIEILLAGKAEELMEMRSGAVFKNSVLHQAVYYNKIDVVKLLLSRTLNVDVEDKYGETPLMYAAKRGYDSIVSLLYNNGAKPLRRCKRGWNSIDGAKVYNRRNTVDVLQQHMDQDAESDNGKYSGYTIIEARGLHRREYGYLPN